MQNDSKPILPRWLVLGILGIFCAHYSIILINHFSRHMLPKSLFYASSQFLAPWFYQNLTAFAPEPPFNRHVFVYRVKDKSGWSKWDYPAYPYLQKQWQNRFDPAIKTHDQLELVGDNLYWTAHSYPGEKIYLTEQGSKLPAVVSCKKVMQKVQGQLLEIDSFQVAVYIERLRVNEEGVLSRTDSALFFPKYVWDAED